MLGTVTAADLERRVRVGQFSWPFYVQDGPAAWSRLTGLAASLDADKLVVITDGGVPDGPAAAVMTSLAQARSQDADFVVSLEVSARETDKTPASVGDLADRALRAGITRRSVVVALGGGLVGNMAGLLAGQIFRGIRLVHIPTTFLAVSDSVLSMKQAVNSGEGKNHLGMFKAPDWVWSHLDLMRTLPPGAVTAGLCEAIKNVVCILPARIDDMARRLRPDAAVYSAEDLIWFIDLCLDAKQVVMAGDPYEKGPALVLEYGHTAGHAAEILSGGRMPHGLAIGVGGLAAATVAAEMGFPNAREIGQIHEELLTRNGAPTSFTPGITAGSIMSVISHDNKRGYLVPRCGFADMVLLTALGRAHQSPAAAGDFPMIPLTQAPLDAVLAGVRSRITP